MNRKHISVWALYDFANSAYPAVVTVVFGVYFTKVIIGNEEGLGDLWWGRVLSVSMLFVALSSPILGSVSDRAGVRKKMLAAYTLLCVVCVCLFTTIEPGMLLWAFVLSVLANIGFEGGLVYYNAYLPDIAPPERQGFVSGLGFGTGYAGSAVALLIALPLVSQGRFDLTWLSVGLFFAVFSLPAFFGLPPDRPGSTTVIRAAAEGITDFRHLLGDVLHHPNIRRFLLAFFAYIDGVNTVIYFAAIYAAKTLQFEDVELIYLFLIVQISALAGALALARPTDRWGPKAIISGTLIYWIVVITATYLVTSKTIFFGVAVLAGLGLGSIQAASRTLMAELIPGGKEAEIFGFYAFCGKSSSVVGPLVFGGISHALGGDQRTAVLSVAVFFIVGLLLLRRVEAPSRTGPAGVA